METTVEWKMKNPVYKPSLIKPQYPFYSLLTMNQLTISIMLSIPLLCVHIKSFGKMMRSFCKSLLFLNNVTSIWRRMMSWENLFVAKKMKAQDHLLMIIQYMKNIIEATGKHLSVFLQVNHAHITLDANIKQHSLVVMTNSLLNFLHQLIQHFSKVSRVVLLQWQHSFITQVLQSSSKLLNLVKSQSPQPNSLHPPILTVNLVLDKETMVHQAGHHANQEYHKMW